MKFLPIYKSESYMHVMLYMHTVYKYSYSKILFSSMAPPDMYVKWIASGMVNRVQR